MLLVVGVSEVLFWWDNANGFKNEPKRLIVELTHAKQATRYVLDLNDDAGLIELLPKH